MKISPQVYVRGSVEAVPLYCKAFGAQVGFAVMDEKNEYAHCELFVDGALFLAVSEAPSDCDTSHKDVWQTMAFNVHEMGSEGAVQNAFDTLREGGTVIDPPGACDWNPCCCNVIDRFGVFWWIAV